MAKHLWIFLALVSIVAGARLVYVRLAPGTVAVTATSSPNYAEKRAEVLQRLIVSPVPLTLRDLLEASRPGATAKREPAATAKDSVAPKIAWDGFAPDLFDGFLARLGNAEKRALAREEPHSLLGMAAARALAKTSLQPAKPGLGVSPAIRLGEDLFDAAVQQMANSELRAIVRREPHSRLGLAATRALAQQTAAAAPKRTDAILHDGEWAWVTATASVDLGGLRARHRQLCEAPERSNYWLCTAAGVDPDAVGSCTDCQGGRLSLRWTQLEGSSW